MQNSSAEAMFPIFACSQEPSALRGVSLALEAKNLNSFICAHTPKGISSHYSAPAVAVSLLNQKSRPGAHSTVFNTPENYAMRYSLL